MNAESKSREMERRGIEERFGELGIRGATESGGETSHGCGGGRLKVSTCRCSRLSYP